MRLLQLKAAKVQGKWHAVYFCAAFQFAGNKKKAVTDLSHEIATENVECEQEQTSENQNTRFQLVFGWKNHKLQINVFLLISGHYLKT